MTPAHDRLLSDLIDLHGDLDALKARRNLAPADLRAFATDPAVLAALERWVAFCELTLRLRAATQRAAAAESLAKSLSELASPNDRRRAATTLARVTTAMLATGPHRASGGAGRGSAWGPSPDQKSGPPQRSPTSPTSSTSPTSPTSPPPSNPPRTPHAPVILETSPAATLAQRAGAPAEPRGPLPPPLRQTG